MKITKLNVLEIAGVLCSVAGMIVTSIVTGKKQEATLSRLVDERLASKKK